MLQKYESLKGGQVKNLEPVLNRITGVPFHNTSKFNFEKLKGDPNHLAANLKAYIRGFSTNAQDIIERFEFDKHIAKLDESNLLFQVVSRFAEVDLHPEVVPNHVMGSVFEELIRRFAEQSNETAGEHFTPREVIRLMVNLLFIEDDEALRKPGIVRTLFDPACGTGGMLSVAEEYLRELNPDARLEVFGQELNDESYAICKADMMIKGQNPENIKRGNSFSRGRPLGREVRLHALEPALRRGVEEGREGDPGRGRGPGVRGRFGAGLPRINDGSLLFLQHMLSKMKPAEKGEGGSRIAIVFNGSPLFTGDAGSGESEIRRWIIENDWLEAIVALPDQLFYNTGISTYIWVVTNKKPKERKGKVQLINAVDLFVKMRKSLGNKRNELSRENIDAITRLYGDGCGRGAVEDLRQRRLRLPAHRGGAAAAAELPGLTGAAGAAAGGAGLREPGGVEEEGGGGAEGDRGGPGATGGRSEGRWRGSARTTVFKSRPEFEEALDAAMKKAGLKLPAPVRKAILSALSERDESAEIVLDADGHPEPDADLRDYENVPLKEDIHAYFEREVKPHVPDAWIDESKTKVGYEIPFTRHFYKYQPLRPLAEIEAEIRKLEQEIQGMLGEVLR